MFWSSNCISACSLLGLKIAEMVSAMAAAEKTSKDENHTNIDPSEEYLYKSALKQVVEFLNTTLPPVPSEEPEPERPKLPKQKPRNPTGIYRLQDTKKIKQALLKGDKSTYRDSKDTIPTRMKGQKTENKTQKRRINKFTAKIHEENIKKARKKNKNNS